MSLRDELTQQILYDLSADPVVLNAYKTGRAPNVTSDQAFLILSTWVAAVRDALFVLADKVEGLDVGASDAPE